MCLETGKLISRGHISGTKKKTFQNDEIKARGGGVLPYMGYIGICRCEGYGFRAVYSGIGYINQRVLGLE